MNWRFLSYFLLYSTLAQAQKEPADFGDVTLEELAKNDFPDTASAVILFDKGNLMLDPFSANGTTFNRHTRIKILKKAAFDQWWANTTVFVRKNSLSPVKGACYNLENGAVQKSELTKSSIFKSKYNKNVDEISFAFPNVREGSVIEYAYAEKYEGLYLKSWTFQHTIPTLWSDHTMYSPTEDFVTHLRGSIKPAKHESNYI